MKRVTPRGFAIVSLSLGLALAPAARAGTAPVLHPDKLVILSTTDVKGKTAPCGCHVPKGGLSRRASFVDSLRQSYGQVLLVDAGGFVPEEQERQSATGFILSVMKALGTDAVNVGERDLRFGRAFLVDRAARSGLPIVSANLLDSATKRPLFSPYVIRKAGGVSVGIFGLMVAQTDLGPSKDSLSLGDPQATARTTIAELRQKGAQVIVLLSQMGKVDSEDLVSAVDGIDAVVMGRNVAVIENGRMIKNTIACYGGDQGHYMCRTELTLDAQRHVKSAEAQAVMLGPEVPDRPQVDESVRAFEATLTPDAPGATPVPAVAPGAAAETPKENQKADATK
jgi:2',3'-cyclic-nucleotide 2'-phosphodiesterase (5'-nucleotidase family)